MTPLPSSQPGPLCEREPGCENLAPEGAARGRQAGFGWLVLPRHGRRPLALVGRTLLHAGNRCAGLDAWSEITIHETAGGRVALALSHRCHPADGPPWRDAWLCADGSAARQSLVDHDPLHGLPACWAAGRTVQVGGFRAAWQGLLAALLGQAGP